MIWLANSRPTCRPARRPALLPAGMHPPEITRRLSRHRLAAGLPRGECRHHDTSVGSGFVEHEFRLAHTSTQHRRIGRSSYGGELAWQMRTTLLDRMLKEKPSLREYYDSRTGAGLGAQTYGWTGAFAIAFILDWENDDLTWLFQGCPVPLSRSRQSSEHP